ncbi:hypothetical protein [Paraburkholderia aromaticivorans]|uniref:hypothetical protein n=1 Tax=Paraburkholderia aromaticivorans TaxID=2026199 RepID=UPI001F0D1D36|nr:hypothetical protein [Paraburkholderia aromaticivorans]
MEQKPCVRKMRSGRAGLAGRKAPTCPPIGALMCYGERIVRVIAEARGQRVIIESVNDDGRAFRSTVKWISLNALHDHRLRLKSSYAGCLASVSSG